MNLGVLVKMRGSNLVKTFVSILLIFLCLTIVAHANDKRSIMPPLNGRDLQGKKINLSEFKGKVIVISFWATWCGPCKRELDDLNKIYKKRKKDGFAVVAVATDGPETYSDIRGVVKRHKWAFRILPDKEGALTSILNPRGTVPYSIYVDRQGRLAYDHEGYSQGDAQKMSDKIKSLLQE